MWITSPYFIPDEAVFAALRLAVLRGVDVRVLIPSRPDHRIVYAASSLFAFEAVRAGVRMFRYQPGFLHQKALLYLETALSGNPIQSVVRTYQSSAFREIRLSGEGDALAARIAAKARMTYGTPIPDEDIQPIRASTPEAKVR